MLDEDDSAPRSGHGKVTCWHYSSPSQDTELRLYLRTYFERQPQGRACQADSDSDAMHGHGRLRRAPAGAPNRRRTWPAHWRFESRFPSLSPTVGHCHGVRRSIPTLAPTNITRLGLGHSIQPARPAETPAGGPGPTQAGNRDLPLGIAGPAVAHSLHNHDGNFLCQYLTPSWRKSRLGVGMSARPLAQQQRDLPDCSPSHRSECWIQRPVSAVQPLESYY